MEDKKDRIRSYLRTGRRELSRLFSATPRKTYSAERGVQRAEAKRPAEISARAWKRERKFRKRWIIANLPWFGAEEAARIRDKRIPISIGENL